MRIVHTAILATFGLGLLAEPAAAIRLSANDRARVERARPRDRANVDRCLRARKRGGNKGLAGGAAGGAALGAIGGRNLGSTLLGAGAGAGAGYLLGKGAGTDKYCDAVLRRNR